MVVPNSRAAHFLQIHGPAQQQAVLQPLLIVHQQLGRNESRPRPWCCATDAQNVHNTRLAVHTYATPTRPPFCGSKCPDLRPCHSTHPRESVTFRKSSVHRCLQGLGYVRSCSRAFRGAAWGWVTQLQVVSSSFWGHFGQRSQNRCLAGGSPRTETPHLPTTRVGFF